MGKAKEMDCWEIVDNIIGVADRLLLHGPPGTGKTHAAVRNSIRPKQRVFTLTLTEETPAAELRGHYILKEGNYIWQDGPAIAAWRVGGRLVINEIQRGGPDVHALMLAITDDFGLASLDLPNGERVAPKEGFSCVATMNGEPQELLDAALLDRFCVNVYIDRVNPQAIASLPADLQHIAEKTALIEDDERRISIRSWLAFSVLRSRLSTHKQGELLAAKSVFGDQFQAALDHLKMAEGV